MPFAREMDADIGQDLRAGSCSAPLIGHVLQILQRLHRVLRRLRDQVVIDAVLRVQEESRRGLKAAAERDQQAAGDIALREAGLRGLGAVDGDVELRADRSSAECGGRRGPAPAAAASEAGRRLRGCLRCRVPSI